MLWMKFKKNLPMHCPVPTRQHPTVVSRSPHFHKTDRSCGNDKTDWRVLSQDWLTRLVTRLTRLCFVRLCLSSHQLARLLASVWRWKVVSQPVIEPGTLRIQDNHEEHYATVATLTRLNSCGGHWRIVSHIAKSSTCLLTAFILFHIENIFLLQLLVALKMVCRAIRCSSVANESCSWCSL